MLHIDNYYFAPTMEEAYNTLQSVPNSTVLGGCGYLRLGARNITTAIDLSQLGLDFIRKVDQSIEIGAMATLRQLETNLLASTACSGVLKSSVAGIVGVQLRNCVTLGGTVAGRYPFSDPLAALLAINARIHFHKNGEVSLNDYLSGKGYRDIIEKIIIPDNTIKAAFTSMRKTGTDYAILNTAVSQNADTFRIVVGSRPGKAMVAEKASEYLNANGLDENSAEEAGKLAATELQFGDNPRGSSTYREAICPVLVKRALLEVLYAA